MDKGIATPKALVAKGNIWRRIARNKYLYLMLVPVLLNFIIFHYWPMYGAQIAFRRFNPAQGIIDSPWVGWDNFKNFFTSIYFGRVMKNTLYISIMSIVLAWPLPIFFALLLNELRFKLFKKVAQTLSYLPYFVSVVVAAGMFKLFLSPTDGIVNDFIRLFGGKEIYFLGKPEYFAWVYLAMIVWRWMGYDTIIYLAAITGIDAEQYEAAQVDGASRLQRLWYITLPGIANTVIILLIIRLGNVMTVQWQEILLLQNSLNKSASEVIQTFVYTRGLLSADYSFATAVGLFQSVIGLVFILVSNYTSKKISDTSLF